MWVCVFWEVLKLVLLVGVRSEGFVWLVREVRQVLGVGSKMKNWVDCNTLRPCSTWQAAHGTPRPL